MIYIVIAVVLMLIVEAVIIIPDKIPVIRTIRRKVKERESSGAG